MLVAGTVPLCPASNSDEIPVLRPLQVFTSCAACQDGANEARDIVYSPKVGTSDVGRYKASCEHWNNPLVTTSKYYGWYY